jgi:hypothetical protein
LNPINNSSISPTQRAANLHPAIIADPDSKPKRFSKAIGPAYFLLLIIPKDHYWKTLGFDTCKIRYYASLKGNRYLLMNSSQKKIAHQTCLVSSFFLNKKFLVKKTGLLAGRKNISPPQIPT